MKKLEIFKRITKSIFILALVSFLSFKVVTSLSKYIENPTYTISKLVRQNQANLTAMTICPMGKTDGYKESVLKNHGISRYDCSSNLTWSSKNTSISENDLFDNVTLRFDELVYSIKVTHYRGLNVSVKLILHAGAVQCISSIAIYCSNIIHNMYLLCKGHNQF